MEFLRELRLLIDMLFNNFTKTLLLAAIALAAIWLMGRQGLA